jgi:hypothetical protein
MHTYHVAQNEAPSAPITESQDKGLALANLLLSAFTDSNIALTKTVDGDISLALSELVGRSGKVNKEERRGDGPSDCGSTFNDKEPPARDQQMRHMEMALGLLTSTHGVHGRPLVPR